MNKNLKPLTTLMLLFLFAALLAGKFWAYGEAREIRSFSYMHLHPDGSAYIALGSRLFGLDRQGRVISQIDLVRLGADDDVLSDFAFFSNGDLLFRRHTGEHEFVYNLQRYFRLPNRLDKLTQDQQFGLFRCNLRNYSCQAFTKTPLKLNDAFGLSIDWQTDRVFLSDASRHSVYLFSEQGEELDVKTGFFYPNQILYQDNKLYVADTNHHSLSVLPLKDGKLNPVAETMDTRQGPAWVNGEVWPSAFSLLKDRRWILNAGDGMAYGGIYLFDHQGAFQKRLHLPDSADPVQLLQLGEQMLISDFSRDRIYRFDLSGVFLGDFASPEMQTYVNSIKQRRSTYKNLDRLFTGMFVLALAAGFGTAIYQQRKIPATETSLPKPSIPGTEIPVGPPIYWLKPTLKYKLLLTGSCAVSVLLLGTSIFSRPSANTSFLLLILNVLVFSILLIFLLLQARRKIGVTNDLMIMVQPLGRPKLYPRDSLVYCNAIISNGNDFFRIGAITGIYSSEELLQYIYPFIKQGRLIEVTEMADMIMRNQRVLRVLSAAAIGAIAFFIYLGVKSE